MGTHCLLIIQWTAVSRLQGYLAGSYAMELLVVNHLALEQKQFDCGFDETSQT